MRKLLFTIIAGWIALGASGCEDSRPVGRPRPMPPAKPRAAPQAQPSTQKSTLPKAEQRLCTAVVILLDMSSSMSQDVKGRDGQMQPKSVIAREALERTIAYTERWKSHHADQSLCLGLFSFSSSVKQILPTSEFDSYTAKWALKSL